MKELTPELLELLNGIHYATLATLEPDGTAHLTTVWYIYDDNKIYIESSAGSRKYKNVIANPSASVIVDTRQVSKENWVSAIGDASILTGKESQEMNSRIRQRYLTEDAINDPQIGPFFAPQDDATICITPKKWRAFNMEEMDNKYLDGVLGAQTERWFKKVDL